MRGPAEACANVCGLAKSAGTPSHLLVENVLEVPHHAKYLEARLCQTCGQALPQDAKFCPYDGQELERDSAQNSGTREILPARDSLVGWVVDERYEVLQLLGEGGMGCVYRARHRVLGRQFALKALRPELAQDLTLAERFVQEARAAAAISHPNVVSITDFGMLDHGQPYFVMELLEGRTLSSVLRERGSIEPEQVALIARSIASALSAAHEVGVIHRDLKPDNVILLGDETVPSALKVLDFGLAQLLGKRRLTRDDIVYGTPQYMSPEQAAGEPLDARVDVYSLGILMYEMLTGRVPFEADSYMGVLTKQIYSEPTPPSLACPAIERCPGLEGIVLCCLSKAREARYPSMLEIIEALERLGIDNVGSPQVDSVRTRSPAPSRPSLGVRGVQRQKRRPRWWAYGVVGVSALGLALGLLFGRLSAGEGMLRGDSSSVPGGSALLLPEAAQPTPQPRTDPRVVPRASSSSEAEGTAQLPRQIAKPGGAKRSSGSSSGSKSGRPAGQLPRQHAASSAEPSGASTRSFGDKSTPGSSGIANPWAE